MVYVERLAKNTKHNVSYRHSAPIFALLIRNTFEIMEKEVPFINDNFL